MNNTVIFINQLQERIGHPLLGIIIPLLIFIISILLTWGVYRYFVKKQ